MTRYVTINEDVETHSGGTLESGVVYEVYADHENGDAEILDVDGINYYFGAHEITTVAPGAVQNSEEGYYEIPEDDDYDDYDDSANEYHSDIEEPSGADEAWATLPTNLKSDKTFSMTFTVVPEVKDPAAPTVTELNSGIDIGDYITDIGAYSIDGQDVEDLVNHPAHYGGEDDPYEVIKVIEAWGLGFHLGNAVKYIARAGKKSTVTEKQDLEKAAWYVGRELERQ
jgi:hypothetical protein